MKKKLLQVIASVAFGIVGSNLLLAGQDAIESQWGLPTVDKHSENLKDRFAFVPIKKSAVTLDSADVTVKVARSGAVEINSGDQMYVVDSCFSYPGRENTIGWNSFGSPVNCQGYPDVATQNGPQSRWRVRVKKTGENSVTLKAGESYYSVTRTITVHEGRIDFEDTITSRHDKPVGVIVRHGVIAPTDFLEKFNVGQETPANPTIFMRGQKANIALVMNDNFSRRRLRESLSLATNAASCQILRFVLDKGASYTFSWSIYLMDEGQGYFDFINRLRNDWDANTTIDGPFYFSMLRPDGEDIKFYMAYGKQQFRLSEVEKDPRPLQEYLQWRGVKLLAVAPWLDHDPGAMDHVVTWDEYRAIMNRFVPLMHSIAPHVKVIANIETDWVSFDRKDIRDSDRIPIADRSKKFGPSLVVTLDPEVSTLIEDSLPSWKDSFVRDANGRLMIYTYYRGLKAIEQPPVCVFPEVGNKRYEYMMDQIKLAIDELDMDGVYCDEFALGQNGSRRTYGQWDGQSADVDFRSGRFYGQYKDCSLAGIQARVNLINYVHSRGKVFVANRHATSREEQTLNVSRFTENGSVLGPIMEDWEVGTRPKAHNYLFFSVLNTPLGLGIHGLPDGETPASWMMKGAIGYLRHGMVYYATECGMREPEMNEENKDAYAIIKHMFPITPIELGEGFIVGQERILAARSITKRWQKQGEPKVLVLDINGRPIDTTGKYTITKEGDAWRVELTLNDWSEVAIVE